MSFQKKLEQAKEEGYIVGFQQACHFWEKALYRTKGVSVKKRAQIMEQVRILAEEVQRLDNRAR